MSTFSGMTECGRTKPAESVLTGNLAGTRVVPCAYSHNTVVVSAGKLPYKIISGTWTPTLGQSPQPATPSTFHNESGTAQKAFAAREALIAPAAFPSTPATAPQPACPHATNCIILALRPTHRDLRRAPRALHCGASAMDATPEERPDALTPATRDMCAKAFETVLVSLRPDLPPAPALELPWEKGGLFVTWSVPRGRNAHYALRGCIGTLTPARLDAAVERYASHAAFHDSRFDPISAAELPRMKVGVSVLSGFEKASSVYDWDVGVHGIILELEYGRYSATYLPEVCREQGWSKEHCVRSLAEKAGFRKELDDDVLETAVVTRYQSTKAELVFEEYLELLEGQPGFVNDEATV